MDEEKEDSTGQQGETEEQDVLDKLADRFGEALVEDPRAVAALFNDIFNGVADAWIKATEPRIKKEKQLTLALYLFLAFIVSVLALLVYADKVNGETLAFLVGSIVGYLFALMKQHLFPTI